MRKFQRESLILTATVIFFDLVRIFFNIRCGCTNIFDYLWLLLLILIFVVNIFYKEDQDFYSIISIVLTFSPIVFLLTHIIMTTTNGERLSDSAIFMIFESVLLFINTIYFIVSFRKQKIKEIDNN